MVQEVLSLLRPNQPRRQQTPDSPSSSPSVTSPEDRPRHGEPIGSDLRKLISVLTQAGSELYGVAAPALAGHIKELTGSMAALSCRIAVVGQVKAGKSSFINALIERGELLPTHVNPWTAVATRVHFGTPGKPITGSDFTFFSAEEWERLGKKAGEGVGLEDGFAEMKNRAEIRLGEQFHHLLGKAHFYQTAKPGILQNYLCAGPPVEEVSRDIKAGRYADITKAANVYFPLPPMAVPSILIDTPGTNDSTHLRHRITREIIEGADIYIVVITARQALASSDVSLLELLRELEKRRIIVFVNRIDELNERASDAEQVVTHVRAQLARIFPSVAIPVIAGSAKWAALAAVDDVEQLREAARSTGFQAFAAFAQLAIPTPDAAGSDRAALQDCFRSASGLNAVGKLLSRFMLSGFVSNHARGVANVLLSAADVSAGNGYRQLNAVAQHLRQVYENAFLSRDTAEAIRALVIEISTFLDIMSSELPKLKEASGGAARDGIALLETAMEEDIRAFADRRRGHAQAYDAANPVSSRWAFDAPPPSLRREEEAATVTERSGWLSSVKQATFDLLWKSRADAPPQQYVERKPSLMRSTSLTVPVTAGRDVSIDSGAAWWSNGAASGTANTEAPGPAPQQDGRRTKLEELAEEAARTGGNAVLLRVPRVIDALRRFQAAESRSSDGEAKQRLAQTIGECEAAIDFACRAVLAHEKVIRRMRSAFLPQQTAK